MSVRFSPTAASQAAAIRFLAMSASGAASTIWSRMILPWYEGAASTARMAMIASTTSSSIKVKPCTIRRMAAAVQYPRRPVG